ncbi:MAG: Gfo/Idh/MocA family oxidoreductase [Thermoguttaceae bacterium]
MSNSKAPYVSRRGFLQTTGVLAAAGAWTASSYARVIGANDRIRIGFIGAGSMGTAHLRTIAKLKKKNNLESVAVADVWKERAEIGAKVVGAPLVLTDYHKVLDIKDIDYVTIATPEHQHVVMALDAMDAGKALYCEKPMTHTIEEAQQVLQRQKETKLPVQIGVQATSDDSFRSAAEAVKAGKLGRVVQAQIEYVRHYGQAGPWRNPAIKDDTSKPDDLDWDAWLGDAPKIEWNPHHYFEWRNYAAYSGGICTDLFIHRITRIMLACDLFYPRRVVGMGGIWQWPDGRDLPDNFEMICEYPRGMTVYVLGTMSNKTGIDHLIRGTLATLQFTPTGWTIKDDDGKVLQTHKKTGAEDTHLHHTNLHNHLRNGEPLHCPVNLGMAAVVAVNMANESWRTGQMMGWDAENQRMVPARSLQFNPYPEASPSTLSGT